MALSTTLAEALAALAAFVDVSDASQDMRRRWNTYVQSC